jgi:hypothetical protein
MSDVSELTPTAIHPITSERWRSHVSHLDAEPLMLVSAGDVEIRPQRIPKAVRAVQPFAQFIPCLPSTPRIPRLPRGADLTGISTRADGHSRRQVDDLDLHISAANRHSGNGWHEIEASRACRARIDDPPAIGVREQLLMSMAIHDHVRTVARQ